MELLRLQKVKDGKYLKNYELTYLNKKGNEKVYEIVSRNEIPNVESIGNRVSGVSTVATECCFCGNFEWASITMSTIFVPV